ncbi:hypothetical protein TVAG_367460 [Trichomonas vaginalis G3]|uniref:Uncharacterized protein n=1 Tax=Trichomonas vaginalis (strain ATCC PRA-98 / G3) TaxID=412133 RepID=A2F5Q3_TRIV3|nr:ankyrin repeat domain-containing protein 49 family [Trichomonas vaginalis G3]EAX99753.1 hypothetical protein TVAG_367460 [Trichomonas vaginalis G3]KAI5489037.1 ankyrin repeat domain-containing protein 49 family [Trichomonas vaginalis G3]|eukprot:XP_001312683.1 hypothetical protein [Trichomonas vaginalis G3]
MQIDYQYYASNIENIISEDFIKIRQAHQMCEILKLAHLSAKQFARIFNIVKEYFDQNDIISMLKCSNVDFKKDKDNYTVIKCISEILEIKPLKDMLPKFTGDFHVDDILHDSSRSHSAQSRNFDSSQIFKQVYQDLEKAAADNDKKTIEEIVKNNSWRITHDQETNCILYAAYKGNLKLVTMLQECGADPCSKNDEDITILHYFCHRGSKEGDEFALQFIDINATTKSSKRTPLHIAALGNHGRLCTFLCNQKFIRKNVKDSEHLTPLGLARKEGKTNAIVALIDCSCI